MYEHDKGLQPRRNAYGNGFLDLEKYRVAAIAALVMMLIELTVELIQPRSSLKSLTTAYRNRICPLYGCGEPF